LLILLLTYTEEVLDFFPHSAVRSVIGDDSKGLYSLSDVEEQILNLSHRHTTSKHNINPVVLISLAQGVVCAMQFS